jgi:hypothetical protein
MTCSPTLSCTSESSALSLLSSCMLGLTLRVLEWEVLPVVLEEARALELPP